MQEKMVRVHVPPESMGDSDFISDWIAGYEYALLIRELINSHLVEASDTIRVRFIPDKYVDPSLKERVIEIYGCSRPSEGKLAVEGPLIGRYSYKEERHNNN